MCAKKYQKTHPWITFEFDFGKIDWKTWILLGEAQSKCARISRAFLKPELSETLHLAYLAKGIHSTTAIEGNSLSEEEVRKRIEGKLQLPKSMEYQGREVDNMLRCFNRLKEESEKGKSAKISSKGIKNYNRMILEELPLSEEVAPGEIRKHNVGVLRYRAAPPEDCGYLLDRMCGWVNDGKFDQGENRAAFAVVRAVLAHIYTTWIHPFGDGNGRTAKLVELKTMLDSGIPAPACHLLSSHYNKTRNEYYLQLDYASKSGGDVYRFVNYAVQGLVDQLREQIDFIDLQQRNILLRDYIFEFFGDKTNRISVRRRTLCLEFAKAATPLKVEQIRETSREVAEQYAGKSTRTVERDIRFLIEKKLIREEPGGYAIDLRNLFPRQ